MKKRIIAIICMLLVLIPTVIACVDQNDGSDDTTTGASADVTTDAAETKLESAVLPDNLKFTGETVTILSRNSTFVNDEINADQINGAHVNDAIYKRNSNVADRLGITIENILITGDNYVVSTELRTAASAGETYFDIAANSTYSTIMYTQENILYNLKNCEYLDLDAIYWSQGFNKSASIGNAQYLCTGAIALSLFRYMFVTFYNKQLLQDANYENLYDVVDDGRWTLDYHCKLATDLFQENDGVPGVSEGDIYGYATSTVLYVDPYWSSCNITILEKNAENIPVYALDVEKLSSVVDKLITLYHNSNAYMDQTSGDDGKQNSLGKIFGESRSATTTMRLVSVETEHFTSMVDEYGIIPVPKYNEAQEEYYTFLHDQFTSFGICNVLASDEDRVQMLGAVLEAMALYSYRDVVPVYYDIALKGRYLEDSESWEMLDRIYENVYIDPGVLYTKTLNSIHQSPRDMVLKANNTVSSTFRTMSTIVTKLLKNMVNDILELEN